MRKGLHLRPRFRQQRMVTMNSPEATISENEVFSSELVFQRMLILERKKTERSGRPFLLVLLNIEDLLKESKRPVDVVKQDLATALSESTREIDVKGWYRQDSLIGIICTEVDRGKKDAVVAKLKNKLFVFFGLAEMKLIRMYLIDYPEYETQLNQNSAAHVIEELQPERKGMFYS
jgi:hypothetical protein